jgi:hypothetical protein
MTGDEGDDAAADAEVEEALAERQPTRTGEEASTSGDDDRSPEGRTPADDDADQADDAEGGEDHPRGSGRNGGASGEVLELSVPQNLLRAWEHQAEQAKLSVSEYVVRMTEAGRMSVQMQPAGGDESGAAMSVEQLTDEIVDELRHENAVAWEQLVDAISRNLEERMEEALGRLQEDDVVRYSGLEGGYHLVEED